MLQLMCSWLSTSAEGKQALALPNLGAPLLMHAAEIVAKLTYQGEALPLRLTTRSLYVLSPMLLLGHAGHSKKLAQACSSENTRGCGVLQISSEDLPRVPSSSARPVTWQYMSRPF